MLLVGRSRSAAGHENDGTGATEQCEQVPQTFTLSVASTTARAGVPPYPPHPRHHTICWSALPRESQGAGDISEFKQWLAQQVDRQDAVGRLAREWGTLWMEPDDTALPSAVRQALTEFRRR